MRKTISFLLALFMISSLCIRPVCADGSGTEGTAPDTLAEELGFESKQGPDDSAGADLSTAALLSHLIVSSYAAQTSENSRLYLADMYSFIADNINSEAADAEAKAQLDQFMETIGALRMPAAGRKKIRRMYQTNQAHALRLTVDEPAALLSFSHSFSLQDLVDAGLCIPTDSSAGYTFTENPLDLYFFQENPSLSEEKTQKLSEARNTLSAYLADFVKARGLAEQYALSEEAASALAKCRNSRNPAEKTQFLNENAETYSESPDYWALLAECSYENGEYARCLSALESYREKQGAVYLKDREYARLIPYGIVSLQKTVSVTDTRIEKIEQLLEQLIRNTSPEDWALRYFAAHAYLEISRASNNPYIKPRYLNNACIISRSVTEYLADEQRNNNSAWMADLIQEKEPAGASKEDKKEIRDLNRLLKEDRKTSLPPVSEALMLGADLMHELAQRAENADADPYTILYPDEGPLFLNPYAERLYRQETPDVPVPEVTFDKKKTAVTASCLAYDYSVRVVVTHGTDTYTLDDWALSDVKRKDPDDLSTWTAELTSEKAAHMKYEENMEVYVEVIPSGILPCEPVTVKYRTVPAKIFFFFNTVKLEKMD